MGSICLSRNRVVDAVELEGLEPEDFRFRQAQIAKGGVAARAEIANGKANQGAFEAAVRIATPIEDMYSLVTGVDFDGNVANRGISAGMILLTGAPGVKGEVKAGIAATEKTATKVGGELVNDAKKTNFVVTPDGVSVPTDQKVMREGFDNAGFPSRETTKTEKGMIHTVPTQNGKVDVRTMEGSSKHPKRAVITHPNTDSPKTPSGTTTRNKDYNHIDQH